MINRVKVTPPVPRPPHFPHPPVPRRPPPPPALPVSAQQRASFVQSTCIFCTTPQFAALTVLGPLFLLLLSPQADAAQIAKLAASLRRKGRQVLEQGWHDSQHCGHYRLVDTQKGRLRVWGVGVGYKALNPTRLLVDTSQLAGQPYMSPHSCRVLCCAVLCCTALCCTALCCIVLCCTVLYCTIAVHTRLQPGPYVRGVFATCSAAL